MVRPPPALLVSRAWTPRAAGAVVLALAAFFSWALLAVGAWAALLTLLRDGWRPAAVLAAVCAVPFLGFNAALAAGWGYDPIGTLEATEGVYRNSLASIRPYWCWVVGSPAAWALAAGLPIVIAAGRHATLASVATFSVIGIASVLGFTKAETERIWLFLVALACVAAAEHVPTGRLRLVVALLLGQALGMQLLFQTVW